MPMVDSTDLVKNTEEEVPMALDYTSTVVEA
jgi:hypothetical protein